MVVFFENNFKNSIDFISDIEIPLDQHKFFAKNTTETNAETASSVIFLRELYVCKLGSAE